MSTLSWEITAATVPTPVNGDLSRARISSAKRPLSTGHSAKTILACSPMSFPSLPTFTNRGRSIGGGRDQSAPTNRTLQATQSLSPSSIPPAAPPCPITIFARGSPSQLFLFHLFIHQKTSRNSRHLLQRERDFLTGISDGNYS